MRNLVLTFCLFLFQNLFLNAQVKTDSLNFTSTITTKFNDLTIKTIKGEAIAFYKEQIFTGFAKSYFEDGKVQSAEQYVHGKKEGEFTAWFKNGKMMRHGHLKNGKEEGKYTEYYENGNPRSSAQYDDGLKNGKWQDWYESGILHTEKFFENNQLHGKMRIWNEDGKPANEYEYKHGKLIKDIAKK